MMPWPEYPVQPLLVHHQTGLSYPREGGAGVGWIAKICSGGMFAGPADTSVAEQNIEYAT